MIITEYDYDTYVEKNKILSIYISNFFTTKTLLLIGYSFDDIDMRTLWKIIGSRLGKLSTPAYAILVDASPIETARFERRNIKVIKKFLILRNKDEIVNPKLTTYQIELAQVEIEIEKLLDTLIGPNMALLAYANKKTNFNQRKTQYISFSHS